MKTLITGAGGFVGKRLTRLLADSDHDVVAHVHRAPQGDDRAYFSSGRVTLLEGEIEATDFERLPGGIDSVVALAQSSRFRDFPDSALQILDVNVRALVRLLQWARTRSVRRFVLASSGGVYGGNQGEPFHETDLLAVDSPLGFYLGTKLCSEIVFQNYRQYFETAAVLRPFFIYGPGQRKDMFVARIIESVRSGAAVRLQGRDGLKINPVFVDDAVQAFARSLSLSTSGCHILNVAGPDIVTLRELADMIGARLGRAPVYEVDARAVPVDYVGTTDQARREIGPLSTTLARGLELTLEPKVSR